MCSYVGCVITVSSCSEEETLSAPVTLPKSSKKAVAFEISAESSVELKSAPKPMLRSAEAFQTRAKRTSYQSAPLPPPLPAHATYVMQDFSRVSSRPAQEFMPKEDVGSYGKVVSLGGKRGGRGAALRALPSTGRVAPAAPPPPGGTYACMLYVISSTCMPLEAKLVSRVCKL